MLAGSIRTTLPPCVSEPDLTIGPRSDPAPCDVTS